MRLVISGKEFSRSDVLKLLSSALCVLLRRDMSLNRRVYNWLEGHGAEETNEQQRISMASMELSSIGESSGGIKEDDDRSVIGFGKKLIPI